MQSSMSSSMCLRCLKRSLNTIETSQPTNGIQYAAFSTSSPRAKGAPKKIAPKTASRSGSKLRLTKNKRAANTRPPAVGERKALRKRVVLSNTNAIEIQGLPDLNRNNSNQEQLAIAQGRVYGLANETVDSLRALEAFKPSQGWHMFRRPATLIRNETAELAGDLDWISAKPELDENGEPQQAKTVRKAVFGERLSGKSVLQLQALAMASLRGWVVVHIPEAKDLTIAHTSYEPVDTPEGTMYIQPHYTAQLLGNIAKANQAIFARLTTTKEHKLPVPLQPKASLARLAELGARDPDVSWPVWQALWDELLVPGQGRPPIFYSCDQVDHIMRPSAYLNAQAEPIHAHELTLAKHFVDALAGRTALPNGGMVLAATSQSNRSLTPTLDFALERNLQIQNEVEKPQKWNPYEDHDQWVQDALETVGVMKLQGLSKEEARGVMEYYARSGMMRGTVTDGLVSEAWTLSGGGIIGEIEKGSVRLRF